MSESTRTLPNGTIELAPRTGTAFPLHAGQTLTVIDPSGSQVADLLAFSATDTGEILSNGRSFDYNSSIRFTTGARLYSNRSNVLLTIGADTVSGAHDFLFTPCSADMFRLQSGETDPPPGCFGNFAFVLEKYGIHGDRIPVPFNCFMNVKVDGETGRVEVLPPVTKAGAYVEFIAEKDLIVALTACSAPRSNAGVCKPIQYRVSQARP